VGTLILADPSLVLLIGAAGAGKTTLARDRFAPDEVLSSDALRGAVAGDEADQLASRLAFSILHRALGRRLAAGQLTVVDATNVRAAHRRPLLARARAAGVPVAAIVLDPPRTEVLARNAGRARVVDPDVIDRQLGWLRDTVDGGQLAVEGIDPVIVLRTPADVAALVIVRGTVSPPR
jgi:predicted kinase